MPALYLLSDDGRSGWRVWPDAETPEPGSVRETGRYLFELRAAQNPDSADLLIDGVALEALRTTVPGTARWRWEPGFHAGTLEAELRMAGCAATSFEVVTDPDLRKLTRDQFDDMLREILEDTFALFSLSGFRTSIARGPGRRPPPLARLEFIRSRVDELEAAVRDIARNPRRMLRGADHTIAYHRAHRATGRDILRSFQTSRASRETCSPTRLPAALQGFLPEKIRLRRPADSLDLPEHRQIAACLRAWAGWLTAAGDLLEKRSPAADPELRGNAAIWAGRCRSLARKLSGLTVLDPFAGAVDAPPALATSSLFRSVPAYRRFYRLWQDMNAGLAAIFGDFLKMPLARTFELYELWCFLRLAHAAAVEFADEGIEVLDLFLADADGALMMTSGPATVRVGAGWKLCFQRQYREFWVEPDGVGSYSRPMVPDVVIARNEAPGDCDGKLIVLDAKYRIEGGLNDALSSIHTYRDALVREAESGRTQGVVRAAYILTPYLAELETDYRSTAMPGRLFHPQYRSGFRFGAVTLRPGTELDIIRKVLREIIGDATAAPSKPWMS